MLFSTWGSWINFFLSAIPLVFIDILLTRLWYNRRSPTADLSAVEHKTIIVTGATNGIGKHTAHRLAQAGAHVILAVRNTDMGKVLASQWGKSCLGTVEVVKLDLASLQSVREFAAIINARPRPVDILINNAGIFDAGKSRSTTVDGFESHMGVNALAQLYLTCLLWPSITRSPSPRVIYVSSCSHSAGQIHLDDLHSTQSFFSLAAYPNSKLAGLMLHMELHRRVQSTKGLGRKDVAILAVDPGNSITDILTKGKPKWFESLAHSLGPYALMHAAEACECTLHAAACPEPSSFLHLGYCRPLAVAHRANDQRVARELWETACETLNVVVDWPSRLAKKN